MGCWIVVVAIGCVAASTVVGQEAGKLTEEERKRLVAVLDPERSGTFNMVVDAGVQPLVKIYQATGTTKEFSVADGGKSVFRVKDGENWNFYEQGEQKRSELEG
jgi:hypothetical protein